MSRVGHVSLGCRHPLIIFKLFLCVCALRTNQVWYPSSVATLSRFAKDTIKEAFDKSVDPELHFLISGRLHDFGFRGCTCVEQSVLGGMAHMLNFEGSDTMVASYHAQFHLNGGRPVGNSIPATEHSVMTAWETEEDAIKNEIEHFGGGPFACVMDSYDYDNALDNVLPNIKEAKLAKEGGYMVLRPDSGDPVEQVRCGAWSSATVRKCINWFVERERERVDSRQAALPSCLVRRVCCIVPVTLIFTVYARHQGRLPCFWVFLHERVGALRVLSRDRKS